MSRRVQLLTVLLILVALVLSGCNAAQRALEKAVEEVVEGAVGQIAESVTGSEGNEPTVTAGGKGGATTASATATPQEEPAEEETIDADRATDLDRLDSYRMAQVIDWKAETDEGSEEGRMRWEIAYVREPRGSRCRRRELDGDDLDRWRHLYELW